jgi:hypothetical protein
MSTKRDKIREIIFVSNGDLKCKKCGESLTLSEEEINRQIEAFYNAMESYANELTKLFNKRVNLGIKYMKELIQIPKDKSKKYVIPIII